MRYGVSLAILVACLGGSRAPVEAAGLRAGVAALDISPETLPAIINGGFLRRDADQVRDPLFARAFVLDDGQARIALCVVDTCMMPRELIDEAKALASDRAGIPTDRMMVSATHTHTAPAAMGCLGCPVDPAYAASLPSKIAEAIVAAADRLEPARLGAAVVDDFDHTFCRRWIYRADRMLTDPFGRQTVRANMHPGHQNPDAIGPSGPVDPALSVLAIQAADGTPMGVLANYSMHYYGTDAISSDYFGRFATTVAEALGGGENLVVSMSQGTSGDLMWMDYGAPSPARDVIAYADAVAEVALGALKDISYRDDVTLAMAEATLTLGRRLPDDARQDWARSVRSQMETEEPRAIPEVYALEQFHLLDVPERELKLQAIRIGDLGITAIPNEVYGITGLKLKAASPLPITMNIELANGADGYIPPPEQHAHGGYTTWPARTAGLEVQAEPKIVATLVNLLEDVSGSSRRPARPQGGSYSQSVVGLGPIAYYRLDELDGDRPTNLTGAAPARVEPGIALALPGPEGPAFVGSDDRGPNRAIHCAGGRLVADAIDLEDAYSLSFWFWNGLPHDARAITGYLASVGPQDTPKSPGDHLGIGGTHHDLQPGRLFVFNGYEASDLRVGRSELPQGQWCHVVLVRDGDRIRVFLNGDPEPEIDAELPITRPGAEDLLVLGGRSDGFSGLEGKLDEVAVFDRALTAEEVASLCVTTTSDHAD
jgi:hypothetical protein